MNDEFDTFDDFAGRGRRISSANELHTWASRQTSQETSQGSDGGESLDLGAGLVRFGHSKFRPGQREAIETLLSRRCLLLVAPTGGGKSLTYQLPASLLPGTTLVVSPLVALMHDQVAAMERIGIASTYLASTLDSEESERRIDGLRRGRYSLVYVTPERVALSGFRNLVRRLSIPLVAVDEAHCISEWGHDFRPEYMQIGAFVAELPRARVLACTATATPVVRDEICTRLGLGSSAPQILRGFARPNLALEVREAKRGREQSSVLDKAISQAIGTAESPRGCVIVYAPTRKVCEEQSQRLRGLGWRAGCYHAGLPARVRAQTQQEFTRKRLDVVIATNAFGMGIDRADVRAVVHLAPPGSIEAYYQEVGRAGRDGKAARALLMTSSQDLPQRRRLIEADIDGRAPEPAIVEHKWNMFLELMRWAEGGSCRHDAILRYFGDEGEVLSGCGICDVCEGLSVSVDEDDAEATELLVRKALSGIARVHLQFGLGMAVKLLKGARDERLTRARLDGVRTYGILSEHREAWLTALLRRCVTAGWANFTAGDRPLVYLTEEGREVMAGRRPGKLMLPPAKAGQRPVASATAPRKSASPVEELSARGLQVFERLRALRMELARDQSVPPYVVASDRTLRELAQLCPKTRIQLMMVHGIGESRAERYGDEFLRAIAQLSA